MLEMSSSPGKVIKLQKLEFWVRGNNVFNNHVTGVRAILSNGKYSPYFKTKGD